MEQKCSSQVWGHPTPALLQSIPQQQQMVTKRQLYVVMFAVLATSL